MVKQFDDRFGFLNVNVVNETEMDAQFISNNGASIEDSFVISKNK
jgi:hypothetical protein